MSGERPSSILEQTLHQLRKNIQTGVWTGTLPGAGPLARTFHVSVGTIHAALKKLEKEGIISQGKAGVARRILVTLPQGTARLSLRVGILPDDGLAVDGTLNQMLLYGLFHAIESAGHRPFFAARSMYELKHHAAKIRTMMIEAAADAWVLQSPHRSLLELLLADFASPCIAIGGRVADLPIASVGVDSLSSLREAVRRLTNAGHHRISAVLPPRYHKPTPGNTIRAIHEELLAAGIKAGPYHTPFWNGTREDFFAALQELFRLTPPTAIIVDDAHSAVGVTSFLAARQNPHAPVALVVVGNDPQLQWIQPRPAIIQYDNLKLIQRVTEWIESGLNGSPDTEFILIKATLNAGEAF